METVAVYSERPIKTYGLKAERGLVLASLHGQPAALAELELALARLDPAPRVIHAGAWPRDDGWDLSLCLAQDRLPALLPLLAEAGLRFTAEPAPVGLIHLQGPHFGDRYGIVSQALAGLRQAGVVPRGLAAVVHSVFLLIDPAECQRALDALAEHFSAP